MCNTTLWFTEEDNPVLGWEKLSLAGVGFPSSLFTEWGELWSAWCRAICPDTDVMAAKKSAIVNTRTLSTSFSFFSHFVLCPCRSYTVSGSICLCAGFHLTPRLCNPLAISPSVRGLMWDCKWSSLTSISGYQRSICVAQYQAGHSSASLMRESGKANETHLTLNT